MSGKEFRVTFWESVEAPLQEGSNEAELYCYTLEQHPQLIHSYNQSSRMLTYVQGDLSRFGSHGPKFYDVYLH